MNAPLWFSNLVFWSAQAALVILTGGLLLRVLQIQQPRIVLGYWRVLSGLKPPYCVPALSTLKHFPALFHKRAKD